MKGIRLFFRSMSLMAAIGIRATPKWMSVSAVCQIISAVNAAVFAYGLRLVVDSAIHHRVHELFVVGVAMGSLYGFGYAAGYLRITTSYTVLNRADLYLVEGIARLVNNVPGIEHFERPDYLRELDLLVRNRQTLAAAPQQMLNLLYQALNVAVMLWLLVSVSRLFLVLPIVALVPFTADNYAMRYRQRVDDELAEDARLATQLFGITSSAAPAKELRVFGLRDEITSHYEALQDKIVRRTSHAAYLNAWLGAAGWAVFAICSMLLMGVAIDQAINGHISPGQIVMALYLVRNVQNQLGTIAGGSGQLLRARKTADRFVWLRDHARSASKASGELVPPRRVRSGISFDHVSFTYPGTDQAVLQDVSLSIPSGSSVAIVGENGAGKTTLVKLLCRMYEPTSGSILLDGQPISEFDIEAWRKGVTSVFQDFARYELRAGDTVGIGDLPRMDDDAAVHEALARSNSADVLEALPEGLDSPLGKSFEAGRELSGGQWQKLALGRGRMREAPIILVLDEPTASLDAIAEHAVFEHHVNAARESAAGTGAITLLVSHRFSTARMAEQIVVLEAGRVIESGTHRELMASGGLYAELFGLQERAYRSDIPSPSDGDE
jgi:ATP-binding cassette, subfamily B, bacterial